MKKNVVYDILQNNKIWVTSNSVYNYINVDLLPFLIDIHIKKINDYKMFNFASSSNITTKEISNIINKDIIYGEKLEEYSQIDIEYLKQHIMVQTSHYYIKHFYQDLLDNKISIHYNQGGV